MSDHFLSDHIESYDAADVDHFDDLDDLDDVEVYGNDLPGPDFMDGREILILTGMLTAGLFCSAIIISGIVWLVLR